MLTNRNWFKKCIRRKRVFRTCKYIKIRTQKIKNSGVEQDSEFLKQEILIQKQKINFHADQNQKLKVKLMKLEVVK